MEDWEVLSDAEPDLADSGGSVVESPGANLDGYDGDAEGIIRHDYFSLENQGRYAKAAADVSEEGSVESDNPSWIDPGSVTRYGGRESGGFWSDTASDRSDGRKSNDFDVKNELGFPGNEKGQVGSGEVEAAGESLGEFGSGRSELGGLGAETQARVEGTEEMRSVDKDLGKFWSDSGGDGLVSVKFEKAEVEIGRGFRELDSGSSLEKEPEVGEAVESQSAEVEEAKSEAKSGGEVVKRTILWWKVPLEVLKYCVFRVSPVWSVSVAAAVIGLVFLGRRLYKMKRKSQSLQLKVTLDDKKVSQFMSRAARLNEAFSVVKRVPVLRPSLPATGVNPWPVMSLR